jgi:hypothetical protein
MVNSPTQQTSQEQTMCEHQRRLAQAAYELKQQQGQGIIDLGKLRHMLNAKDECEDGEWTNE